MTLKRPAPCAALVCSAGALLLAIGATMVGCAPWSPPPSLVIVVVDTLRADHLGTYGYRVHATSPNLDARAPSAAVFERAFSTAPWTLPAFGSLLTGRLPSRHQAGRIIGEEIDFEGDDLHDIVEHAGKAFYQLDASLPTLASILRESGYDTGAIINNAFLSPEFGLTRGFDTYDYDAAHPAHPAEAVTDRALEWLRKREVEGEGAPFVLLVHYLDPHMPYSAPEPFLGRFAAAYNDDRLELPIADMSRLRTPIRNRDEGWQRYMALEQALYDEEIAYTDAQVERLFAALDERGFLDDGYLVLTSDHGEEFYEHGRAEHGHTVFNELIRVPLLMWGPQVRPGRYALPVSLLDVMPTLLQAAGVTPSDELEGMSLWPALREGPATRVASAIRFDRPLVAEGILYGDEKKALLRWPWKVLADIEDAAELLYNLEDDPEELAGTSASELDDESRDRMLSLLAELQEKIALASASGGGQGAALSEETLRQLRALGYIR